MILISPMFAQAMQCEAVNAFVTDSSTNYQWKPFQNFSENDKMTTGSSNEGTCNFTLSYNIHNGDTYYVAISDSETNVSVSGLAAFDSKGRFQFALNKLAIGTVCNLRCTK
jgi:hypothetical protein